MADSIKVANGRLLVDVAIDENGKPSATGKTLVLYSTRGNQKVEGGYVIGINLYKYRKEREA